MIGCANFSIDGNNIMQLKDTVVTPQSRGRGVARDLMAARLALAPLLGITTFLGATWETNASTVNRLLTVIRRADLDLHDRMLPYVQRQADVANHVLRVARRLQEGR